MNVSKSQKLLSVILGALMGAFLWRCRGEGGWGSFWGLCAVGTVITLLIYSFYGSKLKMKAELIPVGVFMLGAGVTGYATIITQMAGVAYSDIYPFENSELPVYLPIDKWSALWIMLIMGFTLAPLFSFYVCSLFSEKEYKIHHYAIMIAVFFGVSFTLRATVSPYIMNAINPDQTALAARGIADAIEKGFIDPDTPLVPVKAYLAHFNDRGWADDIAFFENYYMSIESISNAIAALVVYLIPLIVWKDKVSSIGSFFVNLIMAVNTTVFDVFLTIPFKTGFFGNVNPPRFLEHGSWGLWEFATGMGLGLGSMLVIALLSNKYTKQEDFRSEPMIKNKGLRYAYFMLSSIFVFGVVPFRALGIASFRMLEKKVGFNFDGELIGTIVCAVLSVILGIFIIVRFKKTIIDRDLPVPVEDKPKNLSGRLLTVYFIFCGIVYFLFADSLHENAPIFKGVSTVGQFFYRATSCEGIVITVMIITFVITLCFWLPTRKMLKKTK